MRRSLWATPVVACLFLTTAQAGPYVTHTAAVASRGEVTAPSASATGPALTPTIAEPSGPAFPKAGLALEPALTAPSSVSSFAPVADSSIGVTVNSRGAFPGRIIAARPRDTRSLRSQLLAEISDDPRIPEPASIVLLVTGIVGLSARRHLRRKRQSEAEIL